ncbi:hypothetical protein LV457_09865 [Mycobacterium sp. MYCO198283]|uniref:hypothetical protein n=1 Tax=Mycobacterium sp. MYCO198283 TaxID=2883505 RepID=UPI001E40F3C2|nr:hypothetical protein [Mycobacterium sp. MYCO198283]MCG5432592.1 hypothetical protein [Mycobacterium sp. MYCO198283]
MAAAGVTVAVAAGCGSSGEDTAASSSATAGESPTSIAVSTAPSEVKPAGLTVDITISGGSVTPTNGSFDAKVGEPIVLRVTSDAPDELHVHSNPEHSFPVAAAPGQSFEFTVDVPGRVDVELHHLDKTVATLNVRP